MNNQINISLTNNQRNKIRAAYKKRTGTTVQLSIEQIKNGGPDIISLTDKQWKDIQKNKNSNKGYRLTLLYNQLSQNKKGGFLPLIFAGIGALGALLGGGAAVANSVIDASDRKKQLQEKIRHHMMMEKIKSGSGLKKKIKRKKKNQSVNRQ